MRLQEACTVLMSGPVVNALRRGLERGEFLVTLEYCLPPRTDALDSLYAMADYAATDPRVHAVAMTDRVTSEDDHDPVDIGPEVMRRSGKVPLVHLSGKDCTPADVEQRVRRCSAAGLENILVVTGDMPRPPKPGMVIEPEKGFVDSVHAVDIAARTSPSSLIAAAVSTFKYTEPELMNQYIKMHKKLARGARLIFNQVGYDLRKAQEFAWYMRHMCAVRAAPDLRREPGAVGSGAGDIRGVACPPDAAGTGCGRVNGVAALYWLAPGFARFALAGNVPGVVFTEDLCRRIEEISREPDKGQARRIDMMAIHILLCRRFGYCGVHIGGLKSVDSIRRILDRVDELERSGVEADELWKRWCEHLRFKAGHIAVTGQPGGFYLFERDEQGLNTMEFAERNGAPYSSPRYALLRAIHGVVFDKGLRPGGAGERIVRQMARVPGVQTAGYLLERAFKIPLVGCQGCGSCSLPDTEYVCVEGKCAKHLLNGPCGGQRDGRCEAYPQRECAWVEIYRRARSMGRLALLQERYVQPKDPRLKGTCSWINLCLRTDHHAAEREAQTRQT